MQNYVPVPPCSDDSTGSGLKVSLSEVSHCFCNCVTASTTSGDKAESRDLKRPRRDCDCGRSDGCLKSVFARRTGVVGRSLLILVSVAVVVFCSLDSVTTDDCSTPVGLEVPAVEVAVVFVVVIDGINSGFGNVF